MPKQFTHEEIEVRVIPTAGAWIGYKESGIESALPVVDDLRAFVRNIDAECAAAEDGGEFSAEGLERRRGKIGERALTELRKLASFDKANKTIRACVEHIDTKMVGPAKPADTMMAAEIRQFVREQQSPSRYVMMNLGNFDLMAAVLNAPSFLTGIKDEEIESMRTEVRKRMHPDLAQSQDRFKAVHSQLAEGIAAAERLVSKRTGMRMDPDGVVRSVNAPTPIATFKPKTEAA